MEMCLNFPDSSTKRSSKSSNVQNSRRDDDSSTSQYQVYYQLPLSSSSSSSSTRSSAQHSPSYKHTSSRSSDSSHTSYSLSSPDPYYISPAISKNPSPELSYYNDFSRSSPPLSGQSSQSYSRSSYGSSGFVQPTETLNTMSSPAIQFSVCPACQTWEHHYASKSRTCAKCGHTRFFVSNALSFIEGLLTELVASQTPGSSVMQAPPPSRTYWRPTQYGNSISFAHVREGYEEADAPIIDMLAAWAATQRSYIVRPYTPSILALCLHFFLAALLCISSFRNGDQPLSQSLLVGLRSTVDGCIAPSNFKS